MALLEVRDLHAGYGRARVLFGVSLELRAGEVVVLAGRNGAGKSTTLKAIMHLVPPTAGLIRFAQRDVSGWETHRIARLGLAYVPEDRRIFTELTVAENLEAGRLPARAGVPAWSEEKVFALFPALAAMRERPGGSMSGGEQKMLAIARSLMGNPAAVLLDEPSEGIAPVVVSQMARAIGEMKLAGVGVLLCEQNTAFARRVADRSYLIEKGRITEGALAP